MDREKSSRVYRDKHRSSKDKHYEDDNGHHHHRSKHRSEDGHQRSDREGSRDKPHHHDRKEESLEKKHSHKRKDRAESVDRCNTDDKRARVSDNNKDNRRLEDEKHRTDDGDWRDKDDKRREERRFEDQPKEEHLEIDESKTSKKEPTDNDQDEAVGSIAKGLTMGSYNVTSKTSPDNSLAHGDSPATKMGQFPVLARVGAYPLSKSEERLTNAKGVGSKA